MRISFPGRIVVTPPSLISTVGMFHGPKSDLMHCLLEFVDTQKERPNSLTGIVIDASFLIQLLKLGTSASIGEFIHGVIIPYLKGLLLIYKRVDIIFDVYLLKSLKYELRVTRGVEEMKRVHLTTKMPRNLELFYV